MDKEKRRGGNFWVIMVSYGGHLRAQGQRLRLFTTNSEKDSLLGQTVLPPKLGQILGGLVFLGPPFVKNKGLFKKNPPFSKLEVPCLFKWQKFNCSRILDNNGIGNCLPPQKIHQETSAGNG